MYKDLTLVPDRLAEIDCGRGIGCSLSNISPSLSLTAVHSPECGRSALAASSG